ncbi:MAG: peroxisome assembly protein (Peroxin-2) [Sarea resinae]|nr:MAG: peroxisome assembly protein (Peroxin-2) [Sarea resinae]
MASADFSLAQQRLAARRRLREAEVEARLARQQGASPSNATSRLPASLSRLEETGRRAWGLIRGDEGTRPAFRVGQVDAELLDEELLELFKGQVGEALKYFGPHLRDDWSSEILLGLRAVLFKLTIWDHDASYGAALQNLRYTDARVKDSTRASPTRLQKLSYGLFSVGGRYAWDKWEDWLADKESDFDEPIPRIRTLSRLTSAVSSTYSMAAFTSFLVFLVNGRYRTLIDRILRLRLAPKTIQVSREVSFEYLNRQLVWHAFTEFLLFLLPLVGIARWRRWLARAWRKAKSIFTNVHDEDGEPRKAQGELAFLPERTCAICYRDQNPTSTSETEILAVSGGSGGVIGSAQTDITNPYEAIPCGCIYCFVCLAQRLEAEEGEGWVCLRCGGIIKECKPWNGDVLEVTSRPGSSKRVGFEAELPDEKPMEELDPYPEKDEEKSDARGLDESEEWAREAGGSGLSDVEGEMGGFSSSREASDSAED